MLRELPNHERKPKEGDAGQQHGSGLGEPQEVKGLRCRGGFRGGVDVNDEQEDRDERRNGLSPMIQRIGSVHARELSKRAASDPLVGVAIDRQRAPERPLVGRLCTASAWTAGTNSRRR